MNSEEIDSEERQLLEVCGSQNCCITCCDQARTLLGESVFISGGACHLGCNAPDFDCTKVQNNDDLTEQRIASCETGKAFRDISIASTVHSVGSSETFLCCLKQSQPGVLLVADEASIEPLCGTDDEETSETLSPTKRPILSPTISPTHPQTAEPSGPRPSNPTLNPTIHFDPEYEEGVSP